MWDRSMLVQLCVRDLCVCLWGAWRLRDALLMQRFELFAEAVDAEQDALMFVIACEWVVWTIMVLCVCVCGLED
jgi:hypothetical protein